MLISILTQIMTLIVWLPYTIIKTGSIFRLDWMIEFYFVIMFGAILLAILITSFSFFVTKRFDLAMLPVIVLLILNMTMWRAKWLNCTFVPILSYVYDDFGNQRVLQSIAYTRLVWLCISLGALFFSFLCIRIYAKSILGSFVRNLRKFYLPIFSILMIVAGCFVWIKHPFLDHSEAEIDYEGYYNFEEANVECTGIHLQAKPNIRVGSFSGTVTYTIRNLEEKEAFVSFWTNPGYKIRKITDNGVEIDYKFVGKEEIRTKSIEIKLSAEKEHEVVIEYGGFPTEWNICETFQGELEISKDYINISQQELFPVPRNFFVDRSVYITTIEMSLPKKLTPVIFGGGESIKNGEAKNGMQPWILKATTPFVNLYVGDYVVEKIGTSACDVMFYYSKKHKRIMDEYKVQDAIKSVFEYCYKHYGPLQFANENGLSIIEIGNHGGGYAGRGSSVMGEDSFNEESMKDTLKGNSGNEVLIHEIVHQWWGLAEQFSYDDPEEAWSSEGLTVYTTYRILKEQFGEEYVQHACLDQWKKEVDDYYQNFYVKNPEYFEKLPEKYQARIHNSIEQMQRYCEMPLKIKKAEELVGGEEKLDEVLSKIFQQDGFEDHYELYYSDFLSALNLKEEDLNLE